MAHFRFRTSRTLVPAALIVAILEAAAAAAWENAGTASAAQAKTAAPEPNHNKAVRVRVTESGFAAGVAGPAAPPGQSFFILDTEWRNIHPREKIEKSRLEGKPDRTMGVGGLRGGGSREAKAADTVEADVAYLVPAFFDHAYLLVDGQSRSLDRSTEKVPGGIGLKQEFSLPKQGDARTVRFVYVIPENARNIAFQFFDYSYGHILIPLRGDLELAAGAGAGRPTGLSRIRDEDLELAATALDFQPAYNDEEAPEGWRYALVKLSGMSLSKANIVQIEPTENIWLAARNGQIYYSCGGSTTGEGYIRFTPEFAQSQEVAFLVPASEPEFSLGVRVRNSVHALALNMRPSDGPTAQPLAVHKDGEILEIQLFAARLDDGLIILDLGIRSLVESGVEIRPEDQFILTAGDEDAGFDEEATSALAHRPPAPFTVPPRTFVRFELAYAAEGRPESLFYRGFESEARLSLRSLR